MHFTDCRVPVANLLGQEGNGFYYMMEKLQQERLVVAIGSQAAAEVVLEQTIKYTQERTAFESRSASSRTPSSGWQRWQRRWRLAARSSTDSSRSTSPARRS